MLWPALRRAPQRAWNAGIVALIPLLSCALYLQLGDLPSLTKPHAGRGDPPAMAAMLARLEDRLRAQPDDAAGWALAGKSYRALGQYAEAARAYEVLHELTGDNAAVLSAWAEAAALANNGVFSPPIMARIRRALELDPAHTPTLWLAAVAAESRQDYAAARRRLQQILTTAADESQHDAAREFLAKIKQRQTARAEDD